MTAPVTYPRHPAHLDAYVEALGPELAVRFLLKFGGRTIYFPEDPGGRGAAERMIGRERLIVLGRKMRANRVEIPIARTWLIQALTAEGDGIEAIVEKLRCTRKVVIDARRKMPAPQSDLPPMPLFDWRP